MHRVALLALLLPLAACGTVESRTLELKGPQTVTVRALGPIEAPPSAVLSDGSEPEGAVVSVQPEGVASVTDEGVVADNAGEATISFTWKEQKVSWKLVVVPPKKLSMEDVPGSMVVGQKAKGNVSATVAGKPTDSKGVTWISTKPGVLSVNTDGELQAVAPGVAYIIVKLAESEAMTEVSVVAAE